MEAPKATPLGAVTHASKYQPTHLGEQSNDQRSALPDQSPPSDPRKWRWLCSGAEWQGMRKWTATSLRLSLAGGWKHGPDGPTSVRPAILDATKPGILLATASTADRAPLWCQTER